MKSFISGILLAATLAMTSAQSSDIPQEVLHFGWDNVYLVDTEWGQGSGMWTDDQSFITACHVVGQTFIEYEGWDEDKGVLTSESFELAEDVYVTDTSGMISYEMEIVSCDTETDLALLKPTVPDMVNDTPKLPLYSGWVPVGTEVYGLGYPLSFNMVITVGHWQGFRPDTHLRYVFTTPIMFGDSGGPVVGKIDGEWYIVGSRLQVAADPFAGVAVPHLASGADADMIREHLKEHNF